MQISTKIFGMPNNADIPAIPQELHLQLETLQPFLAVLMRTYGLSTVQLNIKAAVPISDVQLLKKDMDLTHMPGALLNVRHNVLKSLKSLMLVYGIHVISIGLSEDEWTELLAYWKYLETGKTAALDKVQFKNVPLHFDVDPNDIPVQVIPVVDANGHQ